MKSMLDAFMRLAGLGCLAMLGLIGAGVWTLWGHRETLWRGEPDDGSTYEITLKTDSIPKSFGAPTQRREWVLRVPRSYMKVETGSNSATGGDGGYSVGLRMSMNIESGILRPNPRSFTDEAGWMNYFITLANRSGSLDDLCLDLQDVREKRKIFDKPPLPPKDGTEVVRECDMANCRYYMSYFGWEMEFSIAKSEYNNKDKYCRMTRDVLSSWTIKIQDLRL